MISREELRQLAEFECRHPNEFAVTFYFQPSTPKDKSHREEVIEAKDLVRRTLQELELNGRSRDVVADLRQILQLAEGLRGNQARGKAVFACASRKLWLEFDLPAYKGQTALYVNRRFHLKPLAALFSEYPRLWVALVDRQNAKFLDIYFDEVREQGAIRNPAPRHGRSDGYAGYDAGHVQRHSEDEVRRHYRMVSEFLKNAAERRQFEALVIGCHEVNWPELQPQLHPDVQKKIVGRFSDDLGNLTTEKAATEAASVRRQSLEEHHQSLFRDTLDEAKSNGRGATGLRRVLRALEMGEIDTVLMARDYTARAVECTNCHHLDSHLVPYCPVCGRATRQLDDVCEALVPRVVRNSITLVLLHPDDTLDRIGNIAALLRFRSDRNTNRMLAAS
jgi:peptide subunit release factor 1 (eRF1)